MKITINIPELKSKKEAIFINTNNDKKIYPDTLSSKEKTIYDEFMKFTQNSDCLEIENSPVELYIHRICEHTVTENKYIRYEDLSSGDKKVVDNFIEMLKNK